MTGKQTEAQFQQAVIELLQLNGWIVAHFRTSRTQRKDGSVFYQTAVQADGAGFPDLVAVRDMECLFIELKSDSGRLTPEQQIWRERLQRAQQQHFVWHPTDWNLIVERVSR